MQEIGRFMGRDVIKGRVEQPRSLNEYTYCHNNPVGFVDLNGMDAVLVNKEYHEAVYVKGDFSKSIQEGNRLVDEYKNNKNRNRIRDKVLRAFNIENVEYSFLRRNCGQVTMNLFMKGKLESGESVKAFLNRRGYKEASVLPNINMHIMQAYFGNTAVNKEEYYEQISLD